MKSKVESEVLKLYKRVNPSQMNAVYDSKFFARFFRETSENWINHIKITPSFFTNKRVLDAGCGTGEYDICYGLWGAKVYGIDINNYAVRYARQLAHKFNLGNKLTFKTCSLFDVKFKKSSFDIVICDGVLHHTADPKTGFKKLASYVRDGGFLVVTIGEDAGFFQKNLQRLIVRLLSDGDEKKMVEWAKRLFSENIERAVRFGTRSKTQIIYDIYTVPQQEGLSCPHILALAEEQGLVYYSSWPPVELPLQVNPYNRQPVLNIKSIATQVWLRIVQLRWMLANKEDSQYVSEFLDKEAEIIITFDTFMQVFREIASMITRRLESTHISSNDFEKSIDNLNMFMEKLTKLIKTSEKQIIVSLHNDIRSLTTLIKSLRILIFDCPNNLNKKVEIIKKVLADSSLFHGLNGIPTNYFAFYKHTENNKKFIPKFNIRTL
jgi:2-polyprenyl-3-methyl-5-hydroxy-6-metoxy-1,4-benzoquinol methylase